MKKILQKYGIVAMILHAFPSIIMQLVIGIGAATIVGVSSVKNLVVKKK